MSKRLLFIISVLLFVSAGAFAQVGGYSSTATDTTGKRLSLPTVKVCADALCSTTATIYKDASKTALANPFTGDAQGNYSFFAAPGSYFAQVAKAGYATVTIPFSIGGVGDVVSSANNVLTGNNTHSGTETFTGAISRQGDGEINAALMTGADPCVKASNACAMANSLGWTSALVKATSFHGNQACSISMFTGCPFTLGNGAGFHATIEWGDVNLLADVSQIIPGHDQLLGNAWNNVGRSGTYIQASNSYATVSPKPLIQFGADLTSGNTGTPPEGVRIDHVNLDCDSPNGTHRATMIGVINGFAQENSGGDFVGVENCHIGLARRNLGSVSGAFNDAAYRNWHVRLNAREADAKCFVNGDDGTAILGGGGLANWSCNKGTGATQPLVGWQVDNNDGTFPLVKMHGEGFVTCFDIGTAQGGKGISIRDSDCSALAGFDQTTVVHLSSNFPTAMTGITLENIDSGGITTNMLVDDNTNGGTIPGTSQFDNLGLYVRGKNNNVFSTRPEITSTAFSAITGSATQSTSLMTLTGNASNANTVSLFAITGLGANEKPFTISDTAATFSFSASAHQLQLTPLSTINATSGAQVNSPTLLLQGKFWDGSASQSCSFTPSMTFSPSSGTATTASVSDTLTSCPGIVTKQRDFSGYGKVLLPSTRIGANGSTLTAVITGTATLTYTAIAAQTCQEQTVTVTNSSTTNFGVTASPRATLGNTNLSWSAWVSVAGTVSVRVCNPSAGSITPSAVAWGVTVTQ